MVLRESQESLKRYCKCFICKMFLHQQAQPVTYSFSECQTSHKINYCGNIFLNVEVVFIKMQSLFFSVCVYAYNLITGLGEV